MLSASVLIVIAVFSLVFLAVAIYLIVLSVRLKHLREKLEENDLRGIDDPDKRNE